MAFHQFSRFPREIREAIWQHTVYYESEVCLCWPSNTCRGYPEGAGANSLNHSPQLPLTVDTAYPVAMHVCHESRVTVQRPSSGIRFRASQAAGCPTPFRRYLPELDILYFSEGAASVLRIGERLSKAARTVQQKLVDAAWHDILKKAKWIALEGRWFTFHYWDLQMLMETDDWWDDNHVRTERSHELQKRLSFVMAGSTPMEPSPRHFERFKAPGRRCKLVNLTAEEVAKIRVIIDPNGGALDIGPQELSVAIDLTRKYIFHGGTWEEGDPIWWRDDDLEIVSQTFVEYQTDGTWKEVCQQRMFSRNDLETSPPILVEDRPDPEVIRVIDTEISSELWEEPPVVGWL
ncbi:hypothetical protein VHEMI04287 [[Torrubiella] hemipterigena]|uniref:2EXR domain-containing protein n=1 Tax=[Torrubiella] hemipterigena TaxID=1531966 RepID=A0A0A1TDD6_9HYPO|nr:hypothetical protein VHEMI04287 [[Torrubiella] hemipterigena]